VTRPAPRGYFVTADHVSPAHQLRDHFIAVHPTPHGPATLYYATSLELGAGKSYADPFVAVRGILAEHGYSNVRTIEAQP
jgi:hypothetical protein